MDTSEDAPTGSESKAHISRAENITKLNEVSKQIPELLQTAGTAIQTLTNSSSSQDPTVPPSNLESRKAAFLTQTTQFYTQLKAIQSALLSQVTALEHAELVLSEVPKMAEYGSGITNAGLGNLDVGFLNGRVRDVGAVKEAELVAEARVILERLVKEKAGSEDEDEDEDMDKDGL